ncbi:hypothetical protein BV25DRAFT_1498598 [Artomyces pyxidatus]|uniref:Uncharacterized protein n=1 Tax=Artomyces pyxidatus TaxID=48021 RepID=A0ACB8TCV9_9AGAM|nr:hypothetical protein BV25DRAFT_1498598 [Artomyces pyxidatus]
MSAEDLDIYAAYAVTITLATASVYAGSFGSLPKPKRPKTGGNATKDDADADEDEDVLERLTSEDAWLFPVLGSIVLFGLFLVIKYLGKEWINRLMSWYFSFGGLISVSNSSIRIAKNTLGIKRWKEFLQYRIKFLKGTGEILSVSWRTPSFFLVPLGMIPSTLYTFTSGPKKSALLTNILALSFAQDAMSVMKIDSFKTGCILLSGLFVYDIYWVFGTKVMVSVATNLDVPMKILVPKSKAFSMDNGAMMLGLGDIVVPGIFAALALRYDYHRFLIAPSGAKFTKPYFYAALGAYVSGLACTMAVMHVFHAAQPALLYLSPACILSFFATAWVRGEVKEAWQWSDVPVKAADASKEQVLEKETPRAEGTSNPSVPSAVETPTTTGDGGGKSQ